MTKSNETGLQYNKEGQEVEKYTSDSNVISGTSTIPSHVTTHQLRHCIRPVLCRDTPMFHYAPVVINLLPAVYVINLGEQQWR